MCSLLQEDELSFHLFQRNTSFPFFYVQCLNGKLTNVTPAELFQRHCSFLTPLVLPVLLITLVLFFFSVWQFLTPKLTSALLNPAAPTETAARGFTLSMQNKLTASV